MKEVSIGIDLGTSGLKTIALTHEGKIVAEASANYPLHTPKPGWTEQNPSDWLVGARKALKALVGTLGSKYSVAAIGLSGQMHGMTPLDAKGEVIRPALLWNDQRTADACAEIEAAVPRKTLIQRTGNPAVTGFQFPKIIWLRKHEPKNFGHLRHVLFPKDYLAYALTGEMAAEPSDASGSGNFHLASRSWDGEINSALKISPELFPQVIPSHGVVGKLNKTWSKATGILEGTPVIAGAGDNAGAAIGLGLSKARMGLGSLSLGTSGVIFLPVEQATPDPEGRIHLFCHADGGYHFLGVTLSAAGSLQWYRDRLAPEVSFEKLMKEAEVVPSGSEGLTFAPFLAGERSPYLDPDLRGAWLGLSLAHRRGHMTRALLEGVAMSLHEVLEVMRPLAPIKKFLAIGGGSRSLLWRGIIQAALGVPLYKPGLEEGPARGAAVLGWVGAGGYKSVAAALKATSPAAEAIPMKKQNMSGLVEQYRRAVESVRAFK